MTSPEPALTLFTHPLASYCWKVTIALYENETPFVSRILNGRPADDAQFRRLWPAAKMPVLRDAARERTIPETSIIIEYLQHHYPGPIALLPADPDAQLEVRLWDRFFDLYVQTPMQKLVSDRMRPADQKDPAGVGEATATLAMAYGVLEDRFAGAAGEQPFTLADCAAAPALFYAEAVQPFAATHPALGGYFERLIARPSVRRTIREAQPYFQYFPFREALNPRFTSPDF